ncbi:MAG TPA: hypothetical protein VHE34_18325 [Puia sp.]|uniref:hypothetical protein n=1 Tax=Puia sp. TaxID=2045100 RepID=UPI002C4DA86E|nr:hypothetical protein [Puia sp.]HVU97195.1 hypothetical protein [Puia sp.]
MDLAYKASLKRWALDHLSQRIATTTEAMRDAQDAANSEEKSSAGDKYETGRAMGHLQKEMHARQLAELVRELAALHAVNEVVLRTGNLDFFIGIGLGKQTIGDRTVIFLSPHAPLALSLQGKKAGDTIVFQRESLTISEIF